MFTAAAADRRPRASACRTRALGTSKRQRAPPAALGYYEVEEVEVLSARACEEGGQREPREIFDEAEREPRRQEDKQDAEAFRLLFYTGLRVGEILTLRWGDSDLDGREASLVRRGLSAGVEGLPKDCCPRIVPLPMAAVHALAISRGASGWSDLASRGDQGGQIWTAWPTLAYNTDTLAVGASANTPHGSLH